MNLLIATTNQKKLKEFQELFSELPLNILSLKDIKQYSIVEEKGKTFTENAMLKAQGYAKQSGMLTLGEDSGLCCDALEGAPGGFSSRFSGATATDDQNNQKLLRLLENIPDNCRAAHYVSVIAVSEPDRLIGTVEGQVHGYIGRDLIGDNGFGYDPLFYYPPYNKTFGQVGAEMKHRVSHRSKAFEKAALMLERYLRQKA